MNKEDFIKNFKQSFGNLKLPKMTLKRFLKTEKAIENFINKK